MTAEKGSRHRPWFPFFAGDFINATRRWTCEEIGAYILLLGEQWINEDVPTDEDELARIHPDIAKHWQSRLQPKFPDGRNPRMEELRQQMMERSAKNREAAYRRWGRELDEDTGELIDASADANADASADPNADASGYAKGYAKSMLSTSTSKSIDKPKSKSKNKRSAVTDAMWQTFTDLYPKRDGPDNKNNARKRAETLLGTGTQWSEIMKGLRLYRKHCDEKQMTGTEFVKRSETFLSAVKKHWLDEYPAGQDVDVATKWNSRDPNQQRSNPDQDLLAMADILGIKRNDKEPDKDYVSRLKQANDRRLSKL